LVGGQAVKVLRIATLHDRELVGNKSSNAGDPLLAVQHLELVLADLVEVDQPERISPVAYLLRTGFLLIEARSPTSRREREKWGTQTWATRQDVIPPTGRRSKLDHALGIGAVPGGKGGD
jgi:hypothetical protein